MNDLTIRRADNGERHIINPDGTLAGMIRQIEDTEIEAELAATAPIGLVLTELGRQAVASYRQRVAVPGGVA